MWSKTKIAIIVAVAVAGVVAVVLGVVLGTRSSNACNIASAPTELTFMFDDDGVQVSWNNPQRVESCNVTYEIHYSIDDEDEQQIKTTDFECLFSHLTACSVLYVDVWAISESGQLSEDHVMANYTVSPTENMATITAEVNTTEGVVLSWAKPLTLAKCDVTYEVHVTTDMIEDATATISTETYTIPDETYCFLVTANIIARVDEVRVAPSNVIIGSIPLEAPKDLVLAPSTTSVDEIVATWTPNSKQVQCNIKYTVEYTVEGMDPETSAATDSSASFAITYCVPASVNVTASNSEYELTESATAIFNGNPIENVDTFHMEVDASAEEPVISWTPPSKLTRCTLTYVVLGDADTGPFEEDAGINDYVLSSTAYCLEIDVQVSAILNGIAVASSNSYSHSIEGLEELQGLSVVPSTETNRLTVSWTSQVKRDICNIEYIVAYEIDEDVTLLEITTNSSISYNLVYCTKNSVVTVQVVSEYTTATVSDRIPVAETTPTGNVATINAELDDTAEPVITWSAPSVIAKCSVTYYVEGEADTGHIELNAGMDSYVIPATVYCLSFSVQLSARIGTVTVASSNTIPYSTEFEELQNLDAVPLIEKNQLTVSWTSQAKQDVCNIEYIVGYRIDEDTIFLDVTKESSVSLNLVYCTGNATVTVYTSSEYTSKTVSTSVYIAKATPTGNVATINAELDDTAEPVISWSAPSVIAKCSVTYFVEGEADTGHIELNAGMDSYVIPATAYCLSFSVQLSARIGTVTVASSNTVPYSTEFEELQNLDAVPLIEKNQLTVSWTSQAKRDVCNIEYIVEYRIDEDAIFLDVTTESPVSFNLAYCTENAAVTVYTSSEYISKTVSTNVYIDKETPIENTTTFRAVLDSIAGPLITWTAPSAVARCGLTYVVLIDADTGSFKVDAETDSYAIPTTAYCVQVNVQVSAFMDTLMVASSNTVTYSTGGLAKLQGLSAVPTPETSKLTVSWTSQQEICNIQYLVEYQIDDEVVSTSTIAESSVSFDLVYCAENAIVTVTATSEYAPEAVSDKKDVAKVLPTSYGPVNNIVVVVDEIDDTVASVSWDSPDFVTLCDPIEYTVVALKEDSDDTGTCIGVGTCRITLSTTFCPGTVFTIRPTTTAGSNAEYTHRCDGKI